MKLFYVVFQTGGRVNFKWNRSLAMNEAEAEKACQETRRMGYAAHVIGKEQSDSIGLPETFDSREHWERARAEDVA